MSKLARALALVAMLAAMNLAGMTAVAHAYPLDPATGRRITPQEEFAGDDTLGRRLAQEHSYSGTWREADPAIQQALAQERFYGTWGYGDTFAPAAAEPGGQPAWLTPALGVLAAVLALVAGVAVVAAWRATRSGRAQQTA
jgi:hypothetical protein